MRLLVSCVGLAVLASACGGGGEGDPDGGNGQTVLPVDCRTANADPRCKLFSDVAPGTIGTGVPIPEGTGELFGGFVDKPGNRIVLSGYDYMNQGYVFAVDLTTGDRTLLSGTAYAVATGNQTKGAGPDLGHLYDVDLGPDGKLYSYGANGLHAIDLATGDRTLIAAEGLGVCTIATSSWYFGAESDGDAPGLAIAADGNLYIPLAGPFGGQAGHHSGIGRIGLNGACTVVTMSSDYAPFQIGTGPQSTGITSGMTFVGGRLYYVQTGAGNLYSVDVATGARTYVSSAADNIGTGELSPEQSFVAQLDAQTLWTSGKIGFGTVASALVTVDIATGNRGDAVKWDQDGPLGSFDQAWWAYPHPTLPGVAIVGAGLGGLDKGIVLLELSTGNHFLLSR